MIDSKEIIDIFSRSELTDMEYLHAHLPRFMNTFQRFDSGWDKGRGTRVLDIGAHWLHQSIVFRLGGYDVVAADLPITLEIDPVMELARAQGVELHAYLDLSRKGCLQSIPSDSINVVLLAEIIEHITFNPVEMWKEIYRVMAPQGRVVVTTPNFYRANGHAWKLGRFLRGFGSGISTEEILNRKTMGHHWKEYSLRELQHYFCLLSADFDCVKGEFTIDDNDQSSRFQELFKWFRQGLHLEVDLLEKTHGIQIEPQW